MRYLLSFLMFFYGASLYADEKITPESIAVFLDAHSTAIMQKDEAKLATLFSDDYRQNDTKTPAQGLNKSDIVKIYKNNFLVSKLIINKIKLLDTKITEDGQRATLNTHIFNRYLLEFQGKQNILNQEETWSSEVVLQQGQLLYRSTEKTPNFLP